MNNVDSLSPVVRFGRLRKSKSLRSLVQENHLRMTDFILPVFVEEDITTPVAINSMPDVFRIPESHIGDTVQRAWNNGIQAILLFGISHNKDKEGSDTWNPNGLMARMIRAAKAAQPNMVIISDNCFCEYTFSSHCGVINNYDVDNDKTLANLQKQVVVCAHAGVDLIAPSGMVDGMITAIRHALDSAGFPHPTFHNTRNFRP